MKHLKVDGLTRFFSDGHEGFLYTYYIGERPLEVYLEYDIIMNTKHVYRYSLKVHDGVWFFTEESQVRVDLDERVRKPYTEVAGPNRRSAIVFMVEKILTKPRVNESANVDTALLKEALYEVLTNL